MPLSSSAQALLDACARSIVDGTPSSAIDLSEFYREPDWLEETPAYLARRVEEFSGHRLTIRKASTDLFELLVRGPNLYLAACPVGTADEVVQKLTRKMFLVSLGPYRSGLTAPAPRSE